MLTNHLLYKAISKRQRDPDPFPLGWIKMKQLIVCPQGTQSPVLWEHITGIRKFHVHVILPETKQLDLRGCGDKRCTIAKVNWRGQIRISLFRIVVVYVSQIILKCPLMCATLFFFKKKKGQPILQSCELFVISLSFYLVTSILHFLFPKLLHRLSGTASLRITYYTTKFNLSVLCFQVENHVSVPQLLCWGRTFFAGHNTDRVGAMLFRSPLPSGLTAPL